MAALEKDGITLRDLARRAGLPPRTIRFYIARGLLPGPGRAGRAAATGRAHLERIAEIRRLQAEGLTLGQIAARLAGGAAATRVAEAWWHHAPADGVVVMVRADLSPWQLHKVQKALHEFTLALGDLTKEQSS